MTSIRARTRLRQTPSGDSRFTDLDGTAIAALNDAEGVELSPDMSRHFNTKTISHIYETVLPEAIESNNAEVAVACERVLAKHKLSKPNHVSGIWGPLNVPRNELQVRELFASRLPEYGYRLVGSSVEFPDWLLLDSDGRFVYTEVEHRSSNFAEHEHDAGVCDLIACWEHDWPDCPLPVLEFFTGTFIESAVESERKRFADASADASEAGQRIRGGHPVNFSTALSKYSTPDPYRARRMFYSDYVIDRHRELTANGTGDLEAIARIAEETGLRRKTVGPMLRDRGLLTTNRGKVAPKASKGQQYEESVNRLMLSGMGKSEAVSATAEEHFVLPSTVWSTLSRRKKGKLG